jgi:hypothetical protein
MAKEFTEFVDKIMTVIAEKKTDYPYKYLLPFDPPILQDLPTIGVVFTEMIPERINEQ